MNLRLALYRGRKAAQRAWERQRWGYCNVLLYHRVCSLQEDPQQLCVSPENFHDQLQEMKRSATFLEPEEFFHLLHGRSKFPKNSFAITFDDGYADNYHQALPILETLGLKAIFYVATANIGNSGLFWWDELDLAFSQIRKMPGLFHRVFGAKNDQDVEHTYWHLINACKRAATLSERNALLAPIRMVGLAAEHIENYRSMTIEELRSLAASKSATIGAHTVNHLSIGQIDAKTQYDEIAGSIQFLSEHLNMPIRHFAYPYGEVEHFNQSGIDTLKKLNVLTAAANCYETAKPVHDCFSFPRVIVRNETGAALRAKLRQLNN